jgi:hypothetical protein
MGEATAGAPKRLIDFLAGASNAPRGPDGAVKYNTLPQFFNTWARSAWVDMLAALPEEDSSAAIDDSAAEEFHRLVAQALLGQVTLGEAARPAGRGAATSQRRSLIDWCSRFAKPGDWQSIRSYRCWCRLDEREGGEVELRVAVRHELFSQLGADRRLVEMGAKRFARQAAKYGVGRAEEAERPHGHRAVTLHAEFLAGLTTTPGHPGEGGPGG